MMKGADQYAELRKLIPIFWKRLTRKMTTEKVREFAPDPKIDGPLRIWIPSTCQEQISYYADADIKVGELENTLDSHIPPGILALAAKPNGEPLPYVVPGCRFNELYGWDSYFIARGLLLDGFEDLADAIIAHFCFEIEHYGRILNANRSYYLGRAHPPFLTDLLVRRRLESGSHSAIREYFGVWHSPPRYDPRTGLSKYGGNGGGIPPETEPGQFEDVLEPYARKYGVNLDEFSLMFNSGKIDEPALDEFFRHDRAVRESGHDVSTRFRGYCGDLATIDLQCLLFKYEMDLAAVTGADEWLHRALRRKEAVDRYLWDPKDGVYYDYNIKTRKPHKTCYSATALWALWCGIASPDQASSLVVRLLPFIEGPGGLASTSKIPDSKWQWDWPAGWAPHQILAWEGLEKYGFEDDARRLATKWANLVLDVWERTGKVYEKYNVMGSKKPEEILAEYGNQGSDTTGFGWTNASYSIAYDRYCL